MRALVMLGIVGGLGFAWWQIQQDDPNDVRFKSSDPHSPQSVGVPPKVVDPQGPAPKLYVENSSPQTPKQDEFALVNKDPKPKVIPQVQGPAVLKAGQVNPDAVEYYRQRGYLGAGQETLALLKSQTEIWQAKKDDPLAIEDVSGGLSIKFEVDAQGTLNGAVLDMKGGGAGARLMSAEMVMTGMEPWEVYWETQAPGPVAGTIPVKDGQELHYYCDMQSMDESGSLNEPSRCHFKLNAPTPELQAYLKQADAPPIQKAKSRLEP